MAPVEDVSTKQDFDPDDLASTLAEAWERIKKEDAQQITGLVTDAVLAWAQANGWSAREEVHIKVDGYVSRYSRSRRRPPDPRPFLDSANSWVGRVAPVVARSLESHRYRNWTACDREAPTSTVSACGRIDIWCRSLRADLAIEIDQTNKSWSLAKLVQAQQNGAHAVWVRWVPKGKRFSTRSYPKGPVVPAGIHLIKLGG